MEGLLFVIDIAAMVILVRWSARRESALKKGNTPPDDTRAGGQGA